MTEKEKDDRSNTCSNYRRGVFRSDVVGRGESYQVPNHGIQFPTLDYLLKGTPEKYYDPRADLIAIYGTCSVTETYSVYTQ